MSMLEDQHPWLEIFQQQQWRAVLRAALHIPRRNNVHGDAVASQHPLAAMLFLLDGLAVLKHLQQGSKGEQSDADAIDAFEQCAMYISEMYIPGASSDGAADENYIVPFYLDKSVIGDIRSASATEETAVVAFQSQLKQALGSVIDWLSEWRSGDGKSILELAGLQKGDIALIKQDTLEAPEDVSVQSISPETRPTSVHSQTSSLDLLDSIPMTLPHQGHSIIESLLAGETPSAFPTLDTALIANIARALSDKRYTPLHTPTNERAFAAQQESRHRSSYAVGLKRWILASLLRHYLGSQEFGQQQHKTTNHVRYAREEADDLAIRAYFSRPKRFSTSDSVISLVSPSIASTTGGGYVDPATRAELAAVRRDDKLRWLFGESVNSRAQNPLPPAHVAGRAPYPPTLALPALKAHGEAGREVIDAQEAQYAVGLGVAPPRSPHRRAHSAGNVSPRYRHTPTLSADSTLASPSRQYNYPNYISRSKTSFDSLASLTTDASPREFSSSMSGARLARIDSISTYDSHTRLLKASSSTLASSGRPLLPTVSNAGDLPAEDALRSPAPFATMQRVKSNNDDEERRLRSESYGSNQSEPAEVLMPIKNTNLLTAEEKQNLVKKNRKLRAVLGEAPYVDSIPTTSAAKSGRNRHTLPTTPMSTRSMSEETYETASSTMDSPPLRSGYTDDLTLTSSGLSRDPSSVAQSSYTDTFTSPEMALKSPAVDKERKEAMEEPPWSPLSTDSLNDAKAMQRDMLSPEMQAKEARRRKLMKVQAFLGERVPVSALLEDVGPLADEKTPTKRRAPKLLSRASSKIGGKLGKPKDLSRRYSADDLKNLGSASSPRSTGTRGENRLSKRKSHLHSIAAYPTGAFDELDPEAYTEWQNVTPDLYSTATRGVSEAVKSATVTAGGEPTITAIRRARKLEKVFGLLPPQQLYSHKRPPQQLLPLKQKLLPRDDRPRSAFVQPDEEQDDEDRSMVRGASNVRPGVYRRTSNSSLYRSSIASLRYLAECKDDRLLQDFAKVVLAEESEVSEAETNGGRARSQPDTVARDSDHGDLSDDEDEGDGLEDLAQMPTSDSTHGKKGKGVLQDLQTEGRSSHETDSGSSPPFTFGGRTSNLSFIHPTAGNARFSSVRGHRFAGRDSVLSGHTAFSNADSAFDVASGRSTSRASSRSSMDSVRIQFKRAHKLAHMFGTTRGEVFNRVLDDIVADIQELDEDEEMSDTERREVLENVAALRAAL